MGMSSKRSLDKKDEDNWAKDERLSSNSNFKKSPGRPKKIKYEDTRNVQLRLPVSLLDEIDALLDGESRHTWMVKAIKDKLNK